MFIIVVVAFVESSAKNLFALVLYAHKIIQAVPGVCTIVLCEYPIAPKRKL